MFKNTKHFYLFGAIIGWIGNFIIIIFWRTPNLHDKYLSHIAASNIIAYVILLSTFVLQLIFTIQFLRYYFFAHVKANKLLVLNYYLALTSLLITTTFPIVQGWSGKVHEFFANISVILSLLILILMVFNKTIRNHVRVAIFCLLSLGLMLHGAIEQLAWELVLIVAFEASILLITYSDAKK